MRLSKLGPFLGVNNRLPKSALHVNQRDRKGDYLAAADNVDVDNAGRLRSRIGLTLLQAMTAPHSLRMISATAGYLVRSSVLYAITLPTYSETLVKVLVSNSTMSYAEMAGELYYSNGTDSGRLADNTAYPIGLDTPVAPSATLISGALPVGKYLVALSYCRKSGATLIEEGGISPYLSVERTTVGGFRVTLPGALVGATHINVYLSACNGSLPYLLTTVAGGDTTYDVVALPTGREATERIESVLLPGTLFEHNGRLCSFIGSSVCIGSPYRPGYFLPASGRLQFPASVCIAISAQTGVYIATTTRTYWIPGDLGDVQGQIVDVVPFGAVPGTAFTIPDRTDVGWFSTMGLATATIQGQVTVPMQDTTDLTPPEVGTAVIYTVGGYRRVVTSGWCVNLENLAATTYSGWDYTSVSRNYATRGDGVYVVDPVALIDTFVDFGRIDFESDMLKHMPSVYVAGVSNTQMSLTVSYTDRDDVENRYTYLATHCRAGEQTNRFYVGRGLYSTWFGLELRNTEGAAFTMTALSFEAVPTTRRI